MAELQLTINADNAAFEDKTSEIARILRQYANRIDMEGEILVGHVLKDYNGNTVGNVSLVSDELEPTEPNS